MRYKSVIVSILKISVIMLLVIPCLAQLIDIGTFKGIQIPVRLKFHNVLIEKGIYDLVALKNSSLPMTYYLRIKKGKKILCQLEGELLEYETHGMDRMADPNIPNKPTLKMKKAPNEKLFIFLVETGKNSLFPYLMLRFKMEYED